MCGRMRFYESRKLDELGFRVKRVEWMQGRAGGLGTDKVGSGVITSPHSFFGKTKIVEFGGKRGFLIAFRFTLF